ncbi:MAG: Calx-beta domain-containing protein [Polyangiaceae bacterium]
MTASVAGAQVVVTVDFATSDGTATTAGNDYQATSGTITPGLGETAKQISVVTVGDTANEDDETFTVNAQPQERNRPDRFGDGHHPERRRRPDGDDQQRQCGRGSSGHDGDDLQTATLSAASGKTVSSTSRPPTARPRRGGSLATGGQDYTATSVSTATFASA